MNELQTSSRTLGILERMLMALALLTLFASAALAQKPVNGNGKVVKQMRPLSKFSSVSLNFGADLTIINGETPSFRIEADETYFHISAREFAEVSCRSPRIAGSNLRRG